MVLKSEQHRIKTLLRDTITLLCKNGLAFKKEFSIEALIGVTLDQDDVLLVSINEIVRSENASAEVAESAANHDAEQGCSDAEENHSDKRQSSARPPAVRDIPSRKRPHMAMKREPPESGGGNGNGNAPDRPDGRGGDVWGQAGPPMLSLDSALDDSSFHSSSEHAQDEPSAKRRPPPPQQHDADDDDDDDGQGQHDDNGDEDLYEDDDTKDVIVIKEETDRDEWSGSSCSQQAGPGRPYRHDNSSGIPSGDGTGEVPYSAQGDRDLAAVLQSGSLVPVGMQQAGLPMWSEGGPQGSRTSTVTSDGAAVNQQVGYHGVPAPLAHGGPGGPRSDVLGGPVPPGPATRASMAPPGLTAAQGGLGRAPTVIKPGSTQRTPGHLWYLARQSFSPGLLNTLMKLPKGIVISNWARRELMEHVFHQLTSETLYPTNEAITGVMQLMLTDFPALRDKTPTGYDAWTKSMKDKLANRRRNSSEPEVMARKRRAVQDEHF